MANHHGPEGRRILAGGKAAGPPRPPVATPNANPPRQGRGRLSQLPKVTFVEFNSGPLEQPAVLVLERPFLVVNPLIRDVALDLHAMGLTEKAPYPSCHEKTASPIVL